MEKLEEPTQLDQTKLHNEINQYSRLRITVVTTAVTIFSAANGWIISGLSVIKNDDKVTLGPITYLLPILLLVTLFCLFLVSQSILGQSRVLASYLRITKTSKWEIH